ncbi:MAG: hypothetical protein K2W91_15100, partial [Novosphingobium sp.]|nr:hypothetical protein [Novosphingobium sp.]
RTASDFDGYVLFDSVPYGQYRMRLGTKSAAALGLGLGAELRIDRAHPSQRLGKLRLAPSPAAATVSPPIARSP